jgi:ECF transporter S component (folate family)
MFKVKFSVRLLCQIALLVALEIVFNRFLSIRTPIVKIGFSFVPIVVCACVYGPIWATITYVVADLLGTVIEGNVPLPGLTLSLAIMGFMFGLFLYNLDKDKFGALSTWVHIVVPVLFNQLVLSLLANTYWLWQAGYAGGTYWTAVVSRLVQTAILTAVQIVLIPVLLRIVRILRRQRLVG